MKICNKCNKELSLEMFSKNISTKDGYRSSCKICDAKHHQSNKERFSEKRKEYYELNKDQIREYHRSHYELNKKRILQRQKEYNKLNKKQRAQKLREYYEVNKDKIKNYNTEYKKVNSHLYAAHSAKRRFKKLHATHDWLTQEDHEFINKIYSECKRLSEESGVKHHVDHIVPLQCEFVCGLHVPWNLQIITAEENVTKRNNFVD